MMTEFLDAILPGDAHLGMPPGSLVAPSGDGLDAALALLGQTARELTGQDFAALSPAQRLDCVEKAKRRHARPITALIIAALRAYYTDARVLTALGAGSVPPFPDGNMLPDDDWTLLEPVYERGPIWRPAPS